MSVAQQPSLYFLIGGDHDEPSVYIGETGRGLPRIAHHKQSKDWWQRCILLTSQSTSGEFDRTAAQYLEHQAIKEAKDIQRYTLKQNNTPKQPSLPDHRRADLDKFYDNAKMLLGVLNQPILTPLTDDDAEIFTCSVYDYQAEAQYTDEGMVVLKGSQARKETTPSAPTSLESRRDQLLEQGILKDEGDHYEFTEDHVFSSPSTASSICLTRQNKDWTTWEDGDGNKLDDVYR